MNWSDPVTVEIVHAPVDGYLCHLAAGWHLPAIVQPAPSHHGHYSIMLWREVDE